MCFMKMIFSVILCLLSVQYVSSYKIFQSAIPNGASVPFPCKPGKFWQGVGHLLDEGTGTKNKFGLDFNAGGNVWTERVCRLDSDGDGLTNGEELGDPKCLWTPGSGLPARTTGISHPGICDPWDSPKCMKMVLNGSRYANQQEWLAAMCKTDGLDCPAMNETGVRSMQLRLPEGSKVPPKETTYQCMVFNIYDQGVPKDQDFHIVAATPIVNNTNVVHHAVVFGCTDDTVITGESFECGMTASPSCHEFLHVWTVGLDGECYHPQAGIKIGKTGYKTVAIQLHWNNPDKRSDYIDTSGLQIYYTPNLRRYNAGVLMVGSAYFNLPPRRPEIRIQGHCSGACTNSSIKGSIIVTSAWNHMHYAGNRMDIQLMRNDSSVRYLTDERVYSYDSPQVQIFQDGLEIYPGDSLISNCGYQTMNRQKTTFWGEATQEEMCFGFLTYYPRENLRDSFCVDHMGVSMCDPASMQGCTKFGAILRTLNTTDVYRDVSNNCRQFFPCIDECVETIVRYMRTEKCMQGNVWQYIQNDLALGSDIGREFLSRLYSCKTEVYLALNPATSKPSESTQISMDKTSPHMEMQTSSTEKTPSYTEKTPTIKPAKVQGENDSDAAIATQSGTLTILFSFLTVLTRMMN
ncbi:unnamed protein product [Candidula unifasciata]|uniref:Temptin n=1 Tax=Candidula unifasciata TaxID=100452 RepID=A0A8S3ZS23_9EUPU|nr:unnamed protein product [Candidula unifasciata]